MRGERSHHCATLAPHEDDSDMKNMEVYIQTIISIEFFFDEHEMLQQNLWHNYYLYIYTYKNINFEKFRWIAEVYNTHYYKYFQVMIIIICNLFSKGTIFVSIYKDCYLCPEKDL